MDSMASRHAGPTSIRATSSTGPRSVSDIPAYHGDADGVDGPALRAACAHVRSLAPADRDGFEDRLRAHAAAQVEESGGMTWPDFRHGDS